MTYDPAKHHRRSIRLKGYDYSQPGAYFVTICVNQRECLFGEIVADEMRMNETGHIAWDGWSQIPGHFPNVRLDVFVVMPNHVHGILMIMDDRDHDWGGKTPPVRRGAVPAPDVMSGETPSLQGERSIRRGAVPAPNISASDMPPKRTLGQMVAWYKYQSTKRINQFRQTPGVPIWQRNYYEHIIRNDQSLQRLREYITNNPRQWEIDQLHPNNPSKW